LTGELVRTRLRRALCAAAAAAVVVVAAGCGGNDDGAAPSDGGSSPPLPPALEELDNAVLTRVRVLSASEVDGVKLRMCERRLSVQLDGAAAVVERTSPQGSTWTFLEPGGQRLDGCNQIPNPRPDSDRPPGDPWCSAVVGRLEGDQLTDPRLSLCESKEGNVTGSAWIEPEAGVEWIVVREGEERVIYRVAGQLAIRVMTNAVDVQTSSATIPVDYYDSDGRFLRSSTLHPAVAG